MSIGPTTNLQLEILFQDKDLIVINKAPGLHTDEVEKQCAALFSEIKAVHRLDRDTSGALLLAMPAYYEQVSQLFKNPGEVEKIYWAGLSTKYDWVDPERPEYTFKGFIGSRYRSSKRSHVSFEKSFRGFHSERPISHIIRLFAEEDLAEFKSVYTGHPIIIQLLSGARHQIRAYFDYKKSPILGDEIYNATAPKQRLELHCRSLKLIHPRTQDPIKFVAPLK